MDTPEEYRWVEQELGDAACVTVVADGTAADLLAGFGADPVPAGGSPDLYGDGVDGYVVVTEVPGGVVAVERNGFVGSTPDRLLGAAGSRVAASIFWNVEGDNAFTCVRDGAVVATVDMYDAEDPDGVDVPEELRDLFALAGAEDADLWAVGLAMVVTFTGVAVPDSAGSAASPAHSVATP